MSQSIELTEASAILSYLEDFTTKFNEAFAPLIASGAGAARPEYLEYLTKLSVERDAAQEVYVSIFAEQKSSPRSTLGVAFKGAELILTEALMIQNGTAFEQTRQTVRIKFAISLMRRVEASERFLDNLDG